MITSYLEQLIIDFKVDYPEFDKIKTSVGLTQALENRKNFADLPAMIIEDINFSSDNDLLEVSGDLTYNIYYVDVDKHKNGYVRLEEEFLNKMAAFIKSKKNEIRIENIEFTLSETDDNEFSVILSLSSSITL